MSAKRVPIKAASKLYETIGQYYLEAKMAEGSERKIAWVTSGAPVEILYAGDVIPIYPENHAALCGARKMAVELCAAAEERGFSRDVCSYARTDFGAIYTGTSPTGGLPKPDFLLCCNNICGTVTKWYQHLQRHFGVPLVFLDTPFQHNGPKEQSIAYVRVQLEGVMRSVGEIVGKPIEMDRLEETLGLALRASMLWAEILDLLANRPSPMTSFDTFVHMAPIVVLRGTHQCIDYYELLLSEMKQRVAEGIGAVPGERWRLGWDNIPIWFKLRELSEKFAEHRACLVAATYAHSWAAMVSPTSSTDPLGGMAEAYTNVYINSGLPTRARVLAEMVDEYALDGFVMHSDRSCRAYSFGQYDLARMLTEQHGIPALIIEADMCDSRVYADEQANTRIEAFMETLATRSLQH